jgi:predicted ArsR family transcriptional regulator
MSTDFAHTHARGDDIDTSHDAAESAESLSTRHKAIVYASLKTHGPQTSQEIADRTGLEHAQAWRRVSDLRNDGTICDSGERRPNKSGRQAAVWKLVPVQLALFGGSA